jgi:hypothetical protein
MIAIYLWVPFAFERDLRSLWPLRPLSCQLEPWTNLDTNRMLTTPFSYPSANCHNHFLVLWLPVYLIGGFKQTGQAEIIIQRAETFSHKLIPLPCFPSPSPSQESYSASQHPTNHQVPVPVIKLCFSIELLCHPRSIVQNELHLVYGLRQCELWTVYQQRPRVHHHELWKQLPSMTVQRSNPSSKVQSQGNHYCHRDYGSNTNNSNSYHYSNSYVHPQAAAQTDRKGMEATTTPIRMEAHTVTMEMIILDMSQRLASEQITTTVARCSGRVLLGYWVS